MKKRGGAKKSESSDSEADVSKPRVAARNSASNRPSRAVKRRKSYAMMEEDEDDLVIPENMEEIETNVVVEEEKLEDFEADDKKMKKFLEDDRKHLEQPNSKWGKYVEKIHAMRLPLDHLLHIMPREEVEQIEAEVLKDFPGAIKIDYSAHEPDKAPPFDTSLSSELRREMLKRTLKREKLVSSNPYVHEFDVFYLVKFSDLAYKDCMWLTRHEFIHSYLEDGGFTGSIKQCIVRYENSLKKSEDFDDLAKECKKKYLAAKEEATLKIRNKLKLRRAEKARLMQEDGIVVPEEEADPEDEEILNSIERTYQREMCELLYDESTHPTLFSNGIGYFNPELLKIDRIIYERSDDSDNLEAYFVKWCGLGYYECTWESVVSVTSYKGGPEAIAAYETMLETRLTKTPKPLQSIPKLTAVPCSSTSKFKGITLFSYQVTGVNWMAANFHSNRSVILADEMGLGKTAQVIIFLEYLRKTVGLGFPFLVIAPMSTMGHWRREVQRFTDLYPVVYHGSSEDKQIIRDCEFNVYHKGEKVKEASRFDVLITTYDTLIMDLKYLRNIHFAYLVIDEAQRIKNQDSILRDKLLALKFDRCVLLSGTPIQNNMTELWALLNFVDNKKFPSLNKFLEKYGDMETAEQVQSLIADIKHYILRRLKSDVDTAILPKEEKLIEVYLTKVQKKYYKALYEQNLGVLRGVSKKNVISLRNVAIQLRKCCIHPYLLDSVEDEIRAASTASEHEDLISSSGKMILLDKLLPKLRETNHKVLIFSQWVRVLDLLEDYCEHRNFDTERIDGQINSADRQEAIDRFNSPDGGSFVCLISTRAGGVGLIFRKDRVLFIIGLTLTAADTVILFDSDWNPQSDIQAQARCHRIGQTKPVMVYRLITKDTYEMEMFQCASKKLGLDQAIMNSVEIESKTQSATINGDLSKKVEKSKKPQGSLEDLDAQIDASAEKLFASSVAPEIAGGKPTDGEKSLSKAELERMLKYGAYALKDDDAYELKMNEFCAEDIDHILLRSQVIKTEESGGNDSKKNKNYFSQASFVPQGAASAETLDINDDSFWEKLGLKEIAKPVDPVVDNILPANAVRPSRNRVQYKAEHNSSSDDGIVKRRKTKKNDEDYEDRLPSSSTESSASDRENNESLFESSKSKPKSSLKNVKPKSFKMLELLFPSVTKNQGKVDVDLANLNLLCFLNIVGVMMPFSSSHISVLREISHTLNGKNIRIELLIPSSWLRPNETTDELIPHDLYSNVLNTLLQIPSAAFPTPERHFEYTTFNGYPYVELRSKELFPFLVGGERKSALANRDEAIKLLLKSFNLETIVQFVNRGESQLKEGHSLNNIFRNMYTLYLWKLVLNHIRLHLSSRIIPLNDVTRVVLFELINKVSKIISPTSSSYAIISDISRFRPTCSEIGIAVGFSCIPIVEDLPPGVWFSIPIFLLPISREGVPLLDGGNECDGFGLRNYSSLNDAHVVQNAIDFKNVGATPHTLFNFLSEFQKYLVSKQSTLLQCVLDILEPTRIRLNTTALSVVNIKGVSEFDFGILSIILVLNIQLEEIWTTASKLFIIFQHVLLLLIKSRRLTQAYSLLLREEVQGVSTSLIQRLSGHIDTSDLSKSFQYIIKLFDQFDNPHFFAYLETSMKDVTIKLNNLRSSTVSTIDGILRKLSEAIGYSEYKKSIRPAVVQEEAAVNMEDVDFLMSLAKRA